MSRPPKIFKTHVASADDARTILRNVQADANDENKVEMPIGRIFELFPISGPLNVFLPNEDGTSSTVPLSNGFSKTSDPAVVNFYLSKLAELAGIDTEEAWKIVRANGIKFDKKTVAGQPLTSFASPPVGSPNRIV